MVTNNLLKNVSKSIMDTFQKTRFFASKSNLGNRLLDIYKCPKVTFAKNFWEFFYVFYIFFIYLFFYN